MNHRSAAGVVLDRMETVARGRARITSHARRSHGENNAPIINSPGTCETAGGTHWPAASVTA